MDNIDYYKVMGVSPDANEKDIKTAYRKLARKYHPDVNKAPDAEAKFKELGAAYEVLKDPKKRKEYDAYRAGGFRQPHAQQDYQSQNFDFSDIFADLFRGRQRQSQRADYQSQIVVSLEEAYAGTIKEFILPTQTGGTENLKVRIPAGVKPGQRVKVPAKGSNLFITVNIAPHRYFDLKNNDIYLTLPVAPWEVALGAIITVPTLAGSVELKIPPNSQGGQKLRLKNRGFKGNPAGDQYVLLKIVIPEPVTDTAKELYTKMASTMPFNPRASLGANV